MPRGQLIALEGACGQGLKPAAQRLLRHLYKNPNDDISYWNASGIFTELRLQDPNIAKPSPRTLLLLYAADLAFRLRWEIRPALEQGKCVVAAPYLHTAIGFGRAAGVPRRWLLQLFRFAPQPEGCYQTVSEGILGSTDNRGPMDGYIEFCQEACRASSPGAPEFHTRFRAYLDALERRGRCLTLTPHVLPSEQ